MSIKKMSLLVTSGLLFFIVVTSVINVVSYSLRKAKEKVTMTLRYEITPNQQVASYNYVEIASEPILVEELDVEVVLEEQEEINPITETSEEIIYVGKMTGYGADCSGCSGIGTLACLTANGTTHTLSIDGEYYNDNNYGQVRIVAADLSKFPCGTIVKVSNDGLGEFYAVVLDTGASVKNAWANGIVWMDLAFKTESDPTIYSVTSNDTVYSIQRWGW